MAESILTTHESLRIALKEYITAQYLRRIPVLLEALEGRLDQEGVLFQEPYIESSPAYECIGWLVPCFAPRLDEDFFFSIVRSRAWCLCQAFSASSHCAGTGCGRERLVCVYRHRVW